MKSKTCWFNKTLFGDTLKRWWWFAFLSFLGSLFSVTVWVSVLISNTPEGSEALTRLLNGFLYGQSQYISFDLAFAMLFGAAAGLVFFSYVHSKKQVDFYHSQPVRRETLLCTRYLAGLVLYILPYLLNVLLAYFILLSNGASAGILADVLPRTLSVLLAFAMLYAFSTLCAMLTGNAAAHLEVGFLLTFGATLLALCLIWLGNTFLKTFSADSFYEIATRVSPAVNYFARQTADEALRAPYWLYAVASTALAFALAVFAYRKRPSEAIGCTLVFKWTQVLFRIAYGTLICILLASVLYSVHASMGFLLFGAVMGAFLGHLFCQGQFKRSFTGMFSGWKAFAILCACLALVFCAFIFDIARYDAYVPAQAEIDAAAINVYSYNDYPEEFDPVTGKRKSALDAMTFDSPEMTASVRAMALAGAEYARALKAGEVTGDADYSFTYEIRYTLGSRTVTRQYSAIPARVIAGELTALTANPDYYSRSKLLAITPISCVYAGVMGDGVNYSAAGDAERTALLTALQTDLARYGMPTDVPTNLWAEIGYNTNGRADPAAERIGLAMPASQSLQIPIYDTYETTLALLKQAGITAAIPQEILDTIVRVEVRSAFSSGVQDTLLFSTTDKARIASILQSGVLTSDMGPFTLREPYAVFALTDEAVGDGKYYGNSSYFYSILLGGMEKLGIKP